jgi:hypothetical protein
MGGRGGHGAWAARAFPAQRESVGMGLRVNRLVAEDVLGASQPGAQTGC